MKIDAAPLPGPVRAASRLLALLLCSLAFTASAQVVRMQTSLGDIRVEVDAAKAPKTVDNFLRYVRAHQYDGTVFHRVIKGFMIQGGGLDANLYEKPTRPPIVLESRNGLSNKRGTIAMAREAEPDSATSQFFINVVDNPKLDAAQARDGNGYAVFGHVISGMDVVDKIRSVKTTSRPPNDDVPVTPVTIKTITVEN